ncbi:MAG: multidrug ABC transporter permease [Candidatus Magasanikbacteria bacterium RIFCSPHIGHO2_01_FULL_47_8]|uniref:Transport permease protein n=1 Tax=Candidatus Magasanikbacteria bacterium RIFCSPHIGHO2_01_FULL_47_8 TaxID=1798673 RepID=A0A1F6MDS3_9BACT|nr:MAG: multidrug ABC transporter permease [Candidatus Magasanikbacteria bacterium RIFCSPHIGHO2_01_FULL_47_8]
MTTKTNFLSRVMWGASDAWVLIGRSLTHIVRNMDQLLSIVISPIMFMLLFRYVFGGAINTGGVSYVNFLVAGILVQTAAFGALTTSLSVANDLKNGIIDRFKSLPIISSAVIVGHVTADLVRNTLSSLVMIIVAFLIGFRPVASFSEWLIIWGIILLFTFAMSWIAAIMGLLAKSVEAVQWMGFVAIFPLTFASSAFVPTQSMPGVLKIFAENQPVTHVIEAIRALMVGTPLGNHAWISVVWCVGIIAVSIPLAAHFFRAKITK